jgi:transcriptional regulator GlxA family with amidase domain
MLYSKNPPAAVTQISILLFDRFSNHCLANVLEPLRAANDFSGQRAFDWKIVVLAGQKGALLLGSAFGSGCAAF